MQSLGNERGMALLMVLVVVALLSALLVEFSFSTLVDLRATETFRDRTKAYYLARGGVEAARMILQEDRNSFDHPSEFWGDSMANIPAGDGDVSLAITDLSGRFPLNSVTVSRGVKSAGFRRFVALCERVLQLHNSEAALLAQSLADWVDPDKTIISADDSYYAEQQPPYSRKRAPLDTLDELLMIRHFGSEEVRRLKNFIRVQGGGLNVNTASGEVLDAWQYTDSGYRQIVFDPQDIEALLSYRQQTPFRQMKDIGLVPAINPGWASAWLSGSVTVKGSIFQIESRGRINQGTRVAQAIVAKSGNQLLSLKVE